MPTIGIGCCLSPGEQDNRQPVGMSFVLGRAISFMGATGVVSILNVYILMLAITRRLNGRSLKASKLLTPVLVDATKTSRLSSYS